MKSFKQFYLENVELDEVTVANSDQAFDLKQKAEAHKRSMLKHRDNPGTDSHEKFLKARTSFINAHKKLKALDLPKPELDQLRKGTNISESEELDENIKGWKNAASDISKMRAAKGKDVKLVRVKKDGTENKMHDATKMFRSEDEAQKHHDNITKLNPKSKIVHNLYVDGKHVKVLGESLEEAETPKFKKGDKVHYETSKYSKDNQGVVHSHDGDQVTIKGNNWLGGDQMIQVHQGFVRKQK